MEPRQASLPRVLRAAAPKAEAAVPGTRPAAHPRAARGPLSVLRGCPAARALISRPQPMGASHAPECAGNIHGGKTDAAAGPARGLSGLPVLPEAGRGWGWAWAGRAGRGHRAHAGPAPGHNGSSRGGGRGAALPTSPLLSSSLRPRDAFQGRTHGSGVARGEPGTEAMIATNASPQNTGPWMTTFYFF